MKRIITVLLAIGLLFGLTACGGGSGTSNGSSESSKVTYYIAAGADHSVALKKDGTVIAIGHNKYQQCEVSE